MREGSHVLFEFKDRDGTVIYSDTTSYDDLNGSAVCSVWIRENPLTRRAGGERAISIMNGIGTLTILAELEGVPSDWQNIFNYKLTTPIEIRKELPNDSQLIFELQKPSASFTEVKEVDEKNTVFSQSYIEVSGSNFNTISGQVKYVELSYVTLGSKTEDYVILSDFEVSSSEYEIGRTSGSDARGLNPISFVQRVPLPQGFKQDESTKFKLRFKNRKLEYAQDLRRTGVADILDASVAVEVTSSFFRVEAQPLRTKTLIVYSGSAASDGKDDIGLEIFKDRDDQFVVRSGSGASAKNIVDIAAREDIGRDDLGRGGIKVGLKGEAQGDFASSVGYASKASGDKSIAIGTETSASGAESIAVGLIANASGIEAISMGSGSEATSTRAIAIGGKSRATAGNAIGIGYTYEGGGAKGSSSTAIGVYAEATSTGATVLGGIANSASADYSLAMGGFENIASGDYSIAMVKSDVSGDNSVGINLKASSNVFELTKPNTFGIGVGNNTIMVVSSSNSSLPRVGIGILNPTVPLHVTGSSPAAIFEGDVTVVGNLTAETYIVSSSVTYMTQSFSSGSTIFGDTPADDTHQFTGSLRVTGSGDHWFSDGNVGIGTTVPASTAGLGPFLEIEGVGEAGIVLTDTTGATPASYNIWSDAGMLKFWDSTYGHRLTLGANGNVGIGNTAPTKALTVTGDISASGDFHGLSGTMTLGGNISGSSTSTGSFGKLLIGPTTDFDGGASAVFRNNVGDHNYITIDTIDASRDVGIRFYNAGSQEALFRYDGNQNLYDWFNGSTKTLQLTTTALSGSSILTGSFGRVHIDQSTFSTHQNTDIDPTSEVIASIPTGSLSAAFFDYVAVSGSLNQNMRAGTVMAVWNSSSVEHTETSTNDIGDTSDLKFTMQLKSGQVNLYGNTPAGTQNWSVKTLVRTI